MKKIEPKLFNYLMFIFLWQGLAAVRASMMGQRGASWSYRDLASQILSAWKVNWRQHSPMPNPIASMYTWSGLAALALDPSSPSPEKSSINGSGVFTSLKIGTLMATFSPLRSLILAESRENLGCPINVALLGQNNDLVKLSGFWGSGWVGGNVKSGQPSLG